MKLTFLALVVGLFVFSGCSQKKYFEPEESQFFYPNKVITSSSYISSVNVQGATLENNYFVTQEGIVDTKLPEGFHFLNFSDGFILASDMNNSILLRDKDNKDEIIPMYRNVIAASKQNELLALIFSDNTIAVYDIQNKQFKLKEYGEHSYLNDMRIAAPVMLANIILFPALDGKVIVIDKKTFKTIRTITVDPENQIKNIILLKAIGDALIVASPNKIITINNGNFTSKEFFIQNCVISDQGDIYIAELDGTIAKYNLNLELQGSQKFRFAKVLAMGLDTTNNLYALELGGYMIKLDNELKNTTIYSFPLENDEMMFTYKNKIYFENKVLFLDVDQK